MNCDKWERAAEVFIKPKCLLETTSLQKIQVEAGRNQNASEDLELNKELNKRKSQIRGGFFCQHVEIKQTSFLFIAIYINKKRCLDNKELTQEYTPSHLPPLLLLNPCCPEIKREKH